MSNQQQFPVVENDRQFKFVMAEKNNVANDGNNPACQINARDDLAAISCWLGEYSGKTQLDYQREGRRLLLWCQHLQHKTLAELKVDDFKAYIEFLCAPPAAWQMPKGQNRLSVNHPNWRPFNGPLTKASLIMAIRIINSLMNYLVLAGYLLNNPIKLIKKYTNIAGDFAVQKYAIEQRMLEVDEWQAVQSVLQNLPDTSPKELDYKLRSQFLFALFYFLGLRINEVASHSWNALRYYQGNWWFFVCGKGGKLGHIPVNHQLLSFIKVYRLHLGKAALPKIDETEHLLISKLTKEPLGSKMLYKIVKDIGQLAAVSFDCPHKQAKLKAMSPHWLRHLSASHQDKLGVPLSAIQQNHRHSSINTTQLYMHTEDERRFSEMQKLTMQVTPSLPVVKTTLVKYNLDISLSRGPLDKLAGINNFLTSIEKFVLAGITWERISDKLAVLNLHNGVVIGNQAINISYCLQGAINQEQIIKAINWEAKIRLFDCSCKILLA